MNPRTRTDLREMSTGPVHFSHAHLHETQYIMMLFFIIFETDSAQNAHNTFPSRFWFCRIRQNRTFLHSGVLRFAPSIVSLPPSWTGGRPKGKLLRYAAGIHTSFTYATRTAIIGDRETMDSSPCPLRFPTIENFEFPFPIPSQMCSNLCDVGAHDLRHVGPVRSQILVSSSTLGE